MLQSIIYTNKCSGLGLEWSGDCSSLSPPPRHEGFIPFGGELLVETMPPAQLLEGSARLCGWLPRGGGENAEESSE